MPSANVAEQAFWRLVHPADDSLRVEHIAGDRNAGERLFVIAADREATPGVAVPTVSPIESGLSRVAERRKGAVAGALRSSRGCWNRTDKPALPVEAQRGPPCL